jgi:pimeloyl-ACP methyl ester carboxylesterase
VTAPRAVVVLHGFLGSRRNVATLARRLGEHLPSLTVTALDLPGHGDGRPLPAGADLAALAHAVLEDARARGLAEPLALVGHSLGGRVALRACLLQPSAIAHATLLDIGPSARESDGETADVVAALLAAPDAAPSREVFRAHFRTAGLAHDIVEWLLLSLEPASGGYRWRIDRAALASLRTRTAAEDLWPAIEGPRDYSLHCVRGALSGYVNDDDRGRLIAAGCPVDTVEGAGHFLHVERPADVVESILARFPHARHPIASR